MGSEFCSRKPHYDITMSKRTRKPTSTPINIELADHHHHHHHQQPAESCISAASVKINQVVNGVCSDGSSNNDGSKKSLKQLIEGRRGTSLGEHFTAEEKQLQVVAVVKQAAVAEDGGAGSNGVKFKHMVSRYTKVLSHMMKLKRDAMSKPHFRLKVQQLQKS